jgi:hypothetical protein
MKSLWKFLLILLFVIFEGFAADPFAENVRTASLFQSDWKMLETRLNAGINELDDKSMGAFLKKDLSPNVLTNTSFLVEMAQQSEYPFLGMAALSLLKEEHLELAYKLSLIRCWSATNMMNFSYVYNLDVLSNRIGFEAFNQSLSLISFSEPLFPENGPVIIGQLPVPLLINFRNSIQWKSASATLHAIVLERLFTSSEIQPSFRETIKADLEELKYVPGLPLAIYLLCGDVNSAELTKMVASTLQEKRVSSTAKQAVLRKHARSLKNLNLNALDISASDRESFKNMLDKYNRQQ